MSVVEHQPPTYDKILEQEFLVFLAGPIQGAPNWQRQAIEIFDTVTEKKIHVANPRRGRINDDTFNYTEQVQWEKDHLWRARKHGAIIFWFAARDFNEPYEEGRSYAQTSRIEFGRVLGWKDYQSDICVAIGIEDGYVGSERYFRNCAEEFNLPVFSTLEDVCINIHRKTG